MIATVANTASVLALPASCVVPTQACIPHPSFASTASTQCGPRFVMQGTGLFDQFGNRGEGGNAHTRALRHIHCAEEVMVHGVCTANTQIGNRLHSHSTVCV